jgi:hypothetical protein
LMEPKRKSWLLLEIVSWLYYQNLPIRGCSRLLSLPTSSNTADYESKPTFTAKTPPPPIFVQQRLSLPREGCLHLPQLRMTSHLHNHNLFFHRLMDRGLHFQQ